MIKKTLCIIFAVLLISSATSACGKSGGEAESAVTSVTVSPGAVTVAVREVNKHGSLILDTDFETLKDADIEAGDIISVYIGQAEYTVPVGNSYTDVDTGRMICRFDTEDSEVALAVNMGSFAQKTGAAEKIETAEEPGFRWELRTPEITLRLKEKKGYMDEYSARNLTRTDERDDYPSLTDEEFANFRAVAVTGIRADFFFRSSTPVEPAIGRNSFAMAAMEKAGIRSVINLDDSADTMRSYDTYPGSYYSTCAVINPEMSYDFASEEFGEKVKQCVEFILENDGPFLIHCKEGKDRTGILCALLECFAGAPTKEITRDYMKTYENYYGITAADTVYAIVLRNNLLRPLCGILQITDIRTADLRAAARRYLLSTGIGEEQLDALAEGHIKPDHEKGIVIP